jgi:HEAT repeat protein
MSFQPRVGAGRKNMKNTVAVLENKKNAERWKAVIDLEKFGQPAAEYLVQALKDDDRWVRYLAVDALANIGATHSIDKIMSLLKDPDQDVRFAAAAALGKLGDSKAVKDLEEVLKKDNGYVKVAAEEALQRISLTAAPQKK